MLEIELDGKKVTVAEGSVVMDAADAAGSYIPHFCYHKKLSIAANCRMCLVDVEKAPKPMPACATPVTQGMVVRTKSAKALKAQQSVMEFLLINHPLDCPICDQGGECQLQDLAVGYGGSSSRYEEEKRVVLPKDVGPLISMEEMSRCIHCTRCVRFGQEIAGAMELGMQNRGEHSEITTFVGQTIDSELSGNMIDICPVGALTSKPFRYSARTWELSRRKSISPHDSTGSNLIVQVKNHRVMRVVPFENEQVNECWIADRDRFSYEALNGPDRLTNPRIKQGGVWQDVDWNTALAYVADGLKRVTGEFGVSEIGALVSDHSTVEEMHLLAKVIRGLGSDSIDYRLRHSDFSELSGGRVRWLGMPIAALSRLDRVLVIGSSLRKDHPLFAQRIRQASRRGAQIYRINALIEDWAMQVSETQVVAPSEWIQALADIATAVGDRVGVAAPITGVISDQARAIASGLLAGTQKAVLLGNSAMQHPQASGLLSLANWIAGQTGAKVGVLCEAANTVGAQLVGATPQSSGLNAREMGARPMKALLLLNTDAVLDSGHPAAAQASLAASGFVVAMTAFRNGAEHYADVMLPIAPFTETGGAFVNAEGRLQAFHGVVKSLGDSRPAWKVIRVLGNLLGLQGFSQESVEEVRAEALGIAAEWQGRLSNESGDTKVYSMPKLGIERISDIPAYSADELVRHAPSLQMTSDAKRPCVSLSAALWNQMSLIKGSSVRLRQGEYSAVLPANLDASLADTVIRVSAGVSETIGLGPIFGEISVEPV